MSPESSSTPQEGRLPSGSEGGVQLAKEDLARRLDVSLEDTRVLSVEAMDWPDTSLGCPEPGMMYAQVITPGFRVMLEAEAKTYEYHTDRSSVVVLCEVSGGSGSKGTDAAVDDGWPSQPKDEGEVDTSRITPIPPPR